MLEGTLLGLVYLLAGCAGILGLYLITFLILCLIKKYNQRNHRVQYMQHNTLNDNLIVRIND
jgi:hypothetical protein